MVFLPSLSPEELRRYYDAIAQTEMARSHFDVLVWLQGDMQRYLPHDIMLTAWGNFESEKIQHDIISEVAGARSQACKHIMMDSMLVRLFERWRTGDHKPFSIRYGANGFWQTKNASDGNRFDSAFRAMRAAMVHGILDKRTRTDCLYIALRASRSFNESELCAMSTLIPYVDAALRQVELMPHQMPYPANGQNLELIPAEYGLSKREFEVLRWVRNGKTNPEIGSILNLSEFTVKNHLQRIFRKLDVSNRAQAVGKLEAQIGDV